MSLPSLWCRKGPADTRRHVRSALHGERANAVYVPAGRPISRLPVGPSPQTPKSAVLAVRQIVQLRGKSKVNKDQEAYFEYFPAGLRPQLTLWLYSIEVCRGAANPGAFFEQKGLANPAGNATGPADDDARKGVPVRPASACTGLRAFGLPGAARDPRVKGLTGEHVFV